MKKIYTLVFSMLFFYNVNAQFYYKTAIGIKLGWGIGLNAKHFIGENSDHAVEVALDFQKQGLMLNGYYEYHLEAFKAYGLRWFLGGGPYIGIWDENNQWNKENKDNLFVSGIVAIMGIEYTLENYPINVALDLQPRFNFIGSSQIWATGGITIRYTFKEKYEEEEIVQ